MEIRKKYYIGVDPQQFHVANQNFLDQCYEIFHEASNHEQLEKFLFELKWEYYIDGVELITPYRVYWHNDRSLFLSIINLNIVGWLKIVESKVYPSINSHSVSNGPIKGPAQFTVFENTLQKNIASVTI